MAQLAGVGRAIFTAVVGGLHHLRVHSSMGHSARANSAHLYAAGRSSGLCALIITRDIARPPRRPVTLLLPAGKDSAAGAFVGVIASRLKACDERRLASMRAPLSSDISKTVFEMAT